MSLALKNNSSISDWQPTATLANLQLRAAVFAKIRAFFSERQILEVETPLLSAHTVTDINIASFKTEYHSGTLNKNFFLQTSPEYAMKRLLAAGSGPIYQICKSFRQGEAGNKHNPEFTMLEWYRPNFSYHQLMDEIDQLFQIILGCDKSSRISYQQLFLEVVGVDPLLCDQLELIDFLSQKNLMPKAELEQLDRDSCLQLILSHFIEPDLATSAPLFVYDFPAQQAALATIRNDNPPVAERFEAYFQGVELANGFHELVDAEEQLQRFQADQQYRQYCNHFVPEIDQRLITALQNGMPNCSGVAIGIDRLLMLIANTNKIRDVLAFDWQHA